MLEQKSCLTFISLVGCKNVSSRHLKQFQSLGIEVRVDPNRSYSDDWPQAEWSRTMMSFMLKTGLYAAQRRQLPTGRIRTVVVATQAPGDNKTSSGDDTLQESELGLSDSLVALSSLFELTLGSLVARSLRALSSDAVSFASAQSSMDTTTHHTSSNTTTFDNVDSVRRALRERLRASAKNDIPAPVSHVEGALRTAGQHFGNGL